MLPKSAKRLWCRWLDCATGSQLDKPRRFGLGAGTGQTNHALFMKPLLFVLLAASLVANVVLGLLARRSASPFSLVAAQTASGHDTASAPVPGQAAPALTPFNGSKATTSETGAARGAVWHAGGTDQDLHRVVAGLRAAGYPAAVIRAVINQLLNERYVSRSPSIGQPFWKQAAPSPETVAAQTALNNERHALFEALLGPDARPSATLDSGARERRYGALPDDKIDVIAKIERDYNEMSEEAWAKRRGNAATSMETSLQTRQLMEKEKFADLAAVLTPEELAQYEMRNSVSARTLINNLRNVEITEAEYARLYQAQKSYDLANPMRSTIDGVSFAKRQLSQQALNEEARAVLGDSRFYSYLEGADRNFANVAQSLSKHPAVTPVTAYQVYQLQIELQNLMAQSSQGGVRPSPERMAELRASVEDYNVRLEKLIGMDAAEAYRKEGSGRAFSPFRSVPRPAAPGGG